MASDDPYVDPGPGILRNKLELRDPDLLSAAERQYTQTRLAELEYQPLRGDFDLEHLKALHEHIFQDVYEWAGELRTVEIAKGPTPFALAHTIEHEGTKLFDQLAKEDDLRGLDAAAFAARGAYYLGEINALHPFREGNGRTQRAFMESLAQQAGHTLAWEGISQAEMIDASIDSFISSGEQMVAVMNKALVPVAERTATLDDVEQAEPEA